MSKYEALQKEGIKKLSALNGKTIARTRGENSRLLIEFTDDTSLEVMAAHEKWPAEFDDCELAFTHSAANGS